MQAVRLGDWKMIRLGPDQAVEIYDLVHDPAESKDRAAQHPELVAEAERILRGGRTPSELFPLAVPSPPASPSRSR